MITLPLLNQEIKKLNNGLKIKKYKLLALRIIACILYLLVKQCLQKVKNHILFIPRSKITA